MGFALCLFIAFGVLAHLSAAAFYPSSSKVVELTDKTFNSLVLKSDKIWVVEFYAPWCGHCKNLKPEYEKAASALEGVVQVGAVDMTQYQSVGAPYKVEGFPTIKIFGSNKGKPKDYQGARTASGIVNSAMSALKDAVKAKLGGKPSSSGKTGGSFKGGASGSDVIDLTDDSFDEAVFSGDNDLWMVGFLAPWCGHCKALKPEWEKAATELKDFGIKVATIDATANEELAQRFQVQGYPTIKMFPPGRVGDSDAVDYNFQREAEAIVQYAMHEFESRGGSVEINIPEIVSQKAFNELCSKGKCCLAVLPDIRDTMKSGREDMINMLKDMQKSNRHTPIGWIAANNQPAWESAYNMNFGFPAFLYLRKMNDETLGFLYRGKFSKEELMAFLVARKSKGEAETTWPAVATTTPWDGQDPPPLEEDDDFDLDAFLNDED